MSLFVNYSLFFLQNVFVFSSALFLTSILLKRLNWPGIAGFLLYFLAVNAVVLLPQIVLGLFKELNFGNLFLFHFFIFVLSVFIFLKKGDKLKEIFSFNLRNLFKGFSRKDLLISVLFFVPLFLLVFIRFVNVLYQIPVEYDNLAYHLPFAVEWLRTGDLMQLYYSAFAGPISYYPSNFELWDLYVMLPFHSDLLVNFLNFPLLVLTGITFYACLSLLKIQRVLACAITALFLSTPLILRQIGVPLVDMYFTWTFLTSLYFLILYFQTQNKVTLYPMAFALGLFVGTKYLGLVYAAVLVFVAVLGFLYFSKGKKLILESLKVTGLILLGGGFWYIRNWWNVGNPLYPAGVSFGGETFLTGYAPINDNLNAFSLWYNLDSWSKWQDFFAKLTSMLAFNSYLFLGAFLFLSLSFCYRLLRKKFDGKSKTDLALLVGMLVYFLLYLKSPYSFNNLIPNVRYALMFVCLAFMALAYFLNEAKKTWNLLLLSGLFVSLVCGLYFYVYRTPSFILNNDRILFDLDQFKDSIFIVAFTLIVFGLIYVSIVRNRPLQIVVLSFLSGFILLNTSNDLREDPLVRFQLQEKWYGDYPAWSNLLKAADWFEEEHHDNAKIAYTGFNFHYPFFGRNLTREVDYVNINDCEDCRYGDFAKRNLTIRANPSYEKWLYNLKKLGKEYVVVEPNITNNVENHEFGWMTEHKESFKNVFQQGSTYIFQIL